MKTKLLIEQHFHGCFGIDFNKASVDDVLYLSKEILKYGIGGIFPTLVTDSVENIKPIVTDDDLVPAIKDFISRKLNKDRDEETIRKYIGDD